MSAATVTHNAASALPKKRIPRNYKSKSGTLPFLWTVENYHRAIDAGIFDDNRRVELINGKVIRKMSQNPPHVRSLQLANSQVARVFALVNCCLRAQFPVTLMPDSEPEPDICVARGDESDYNTRHPAPADILLLVEISDTTLAYDRTTKARLYAQAGIAEYWVVNINARTLEVYRNPQNGAYPSPTVHDETMSVSPLNAPPTAAPIAVADLLP